MINYTWTFDKFTCYPSYQGHTNVIYNIYWRFTADDTQYQSNICGIVKLNIDISNNFIQFENLLPSDVETWVVNSLGEDAINELKIKLEQDIENKMNPPLLKLNPPW